MPVHGAKIIADLESGEMLQWNGLVLFTLEHLKQADNLDSCQKRWGKATDYLPFCGRPFNQESRHTCRNAGLDGGDLGRPINAALNRS